jgi:hypothetical protein
MAWFFYSFACRGAISLTTQASSNTTHVQNYICNASTLVRVNRTRISFWIAQWLDSSSEKKNVDLVNGEVQETSHGVSNIGTKACADNAVPSRPIRCVKILRAKKELITCHEY